MANAATVAKVSPPRSIKGNERRELLEKLRESRASEFIFAVVGYAGSGTSFVATRLGRFLDKKGYTPHDIKAREVLDTAEYQCCGAIRTRKADGVLASTGFVC